MLRRPLARRMLMIGATITLTACTGDGFLSSPESQDSTGGPLDEYWNDQGALVAHGVSGVREGGAATLGVRPFANSSGDDLVITKIEVEEAYGLEVTDIVAASPKRRQEGGEVDGSARHADSRRRSCATNGSTSSPSTVRPSTDLAAR